MPHERHPPNGERPPYPPYAPVDRSGRYGQAGRYAEHGAGPVPITPPQAQRPWVVRAAPGTPFHRLARTPVHRWWRPLVGTLFAAALGLVVMLAVTMGALSVATLLGDDPLAGTGDQIFSDPTANLGIQLGSLAALTPVVLLAAWVVQRRPVGSLSSVTGRVRVRWLLICLGLAVLACLASYVVSWMAFAVTGSEDSASTDWAGWGAFLPAALMIMLLVPFQAVAEEYIFRGWLLQAIASCTLETRTGPIGRAASAVFRTPWPAIVISAMVFTAGHAHRSWALLDVFLFGLMTGWLAVRTGGLEAPIALHVLNNIVAFQLTAATGRLDDALRVTDAPWQGIVGTAAQLGVFALLVLASFRRRGLEAVSPEPTARGWHRQGPELHPGPGARPLPRTT
ncbi:CPBP family intramembrane glutamic endopeptidase [Actinomadura sp. HBU206391]|uniref:CPBP family intramembrane glutamic endopeptidase n=1 Tax=Actinomadura sp. HBU206391 TaxID=2731692 RepID=UPI001650772E|nr:CPBP family intramembrane glutamic endopeptidase [Actinomadura sp. HBU206391]MBC6461744.1 CPBP family intramembrane metalloprotease [Actinomadura sp. HBU206391]